MKVNFQIIKGSKVFKSHRPAVEIISLVSYLQLFPAVVRAVKPRTDFSPSMFESLDNLSSGVQQDGIGVWFGPEDPVTVVEVIGESFRDLVGAAVGVVVVLLLLG